MTKTQQLQAIPTKLNIEQFEQFVLPHLIVGSSGPALKLTLYVLFNYILRFLHMGCQWKELPIKKDNDGRPEIHYTRIYIAAGKKEDALTPFLQDRFCNFIKTISLTPASSTETAQRQPQKKGGDNIGFNGHKKVKGDKVVAFCDRNCNVIAPFISAPGNRNESPLLREVLPKLMCMATETGIDLQSTIVSLDGIYDCRVNRKAIFNRGMTPNINANPRRRKNSKRGRKPLFDPAILKERFSTIERVFAWEDKFRHLLLRFDRISKVHYAFKTLAYTMINLRHFCHY